MLHCPSHKAPVERFLRSLSVLPDDALELFYFPPPLYFKGTSLILYYYGITHIPCPNPPTSGPSLAKVNVYSFFKFKNGYAGDFWHSRNCARNSRPERKTERKIFLFLLMRSKDDLSNFPHKNQGKTVKKKSHLLPQRELEGHNCCVTLGGGRDCFDPLT